MVSVKMYFKGLYLRVIRTALLSMVELLFYGICTVIKNALQLR